DPFQLGEFHGREYSLGQGQYGRRDRAGLDGWEGGACQHCFDGRGEERLRDRFGEELSREACPGAQKHAGGGEATTRQASLEEVTPAGEAAADRPNRTAQL